MTPDPMLDGITRWEVTAITDGDQYERQWLDLERGESDEIGGVVYSTRVENDEAVVLFSDLPALIAKVREDERISWGEHLARTQITNVDLANESAAKYLEGQRDERERIRAGVTGLNFSGAAARKNVLAVIDGGES